MSFVKLDNLNDFIQPSSSCTKPLPKKTTGAVAKVNDVNLNDCLACSGCITSAESVLVQQQNHDELFNVINSNKDGTNKKQVVVSLSLQAIAAMAVRYSMSAQEAVERLASFFISIGCNKVYDINLARHLSLAESYKEFKQRKESNMLPVINSVCPGWICYAEKTNGQLVIPYLSKVRSPQQIMGALVKRRYSKDLDQNYASSIYHLTLMPCFDKKLEASRPNFINETDGTKDVDCVLTPIELQTILEDEGVSLRDFERRKLDVLFDSETELDNPLTSHRGSFSGGYAENVYLAELYSGDIADKSLKYTNVRNNDFMEISSDECNDIEQSSRKFVVVNGFRNIQTIVQRLKRKAVKYDYIEIMACPSGCINGGAQFKTLTQEERQVKINKASNVYKGVKKVGLDISDSEVAMTILKKSMYFDESKLHDLLYTEFKQVPRMQNLVVSW